MCIADAVAVMRENGVDDCDFEDPLSNEVMRSEQLAVRCCRELLKKRSTLRAASSLALWRIVIYVVHQLHQVIASLGRFCYADLYAHLSTLFRENQEAIQKQAISPVRCLC